MEIQPGNLPQKQQPDKKPPIPAQQHELNHRNAHKHIPVARRSSGAIVHPAWRTMSPTQSGFGFPTTTDPACRPAPAKPISAKTELRSRTARVDHPVKTRQSSAGTIRRSTNRRTTGFSRECTTTSARISTGSATRNRPEPPRLEKRNLDSSPPAVADETETAAAARRSAVMTTILRTGCSSRSTARCDRLYSLVERPPGYQREIMLDSAETGR